MLISRGLENLFGPVVNAPRRARVGCMVHFGEFKRSEL
jgi:hypothetical protein